MVYHHAPLAMSTLAYSPYQYELIRHCILFCSEYGINHQVLLDNFDSISGSYCRIYVSFGTLLVRYAFIPSEPTLFAIIKLIRNLFVDQSI
jgi:hypothetical protein